MSRRKVGERPISTLKVLAAWDVKLRDEDLALADRYEKAALTHPEGSYFRKYQVELAAAIRERHGMKR